MDKYYTYYTKQPSCKTPDGKEWFASGGGNKPMELDKSPCDTCFHREACEAWIRHCTTLYDDFSFSVEGCPYYASVPQSILYRVPSKEEWRERYCTNKQLAGIRKRKDGEI